ncbi:MAG TPA: ABC transporter permease [Bryobacteraceae bacterium]|nr:ABC transporter permease [Bryobacteraceae bacterium]
MPLSDLHRAFRALRRRPAFAAAAILTIALGVGANTAVFRIIYPVLLQPLPFSQPDRLVQLWESTPALPQLQITIPDFEDWRKSAKSFEGLAAYTLQAMNKITLVGQGEPEVLQGVMATQNLLPLLGVRPLLGRWFSAGEEREKTNVALLSEAVWRRKFASDPAVAGKSIRLEKQPFTVIGVLRSGQSIPEWADVWVPFSLVDPGLQSSRKYHPLEVIGRLRPGVALEQAQTEIQTISRGLAQAYPATNQTVTSYVVSLAGEMTGDVRPALLLVWGAVGMVLLIACANLAHLVLARLVDRRQEMAIRASLGATRSHLVKQFLFESLLLAAAGGALGTMLAAAANTTIRQLATDQIPRLDFGAAQAPVWLFTVAVSLLCAVLFGMPACWQALRAEADLARTRSGDRSITSGKSRLGVLLMAAEVALSFVALSGAFLLTHSFARLLDENPGIQTRNVLSARVPLSPDRQDPEQFWRMRLFPALRALPGIQGVAVANAVPFNLGRTEHSRFASRFGIEGQSCKPGHFPVAQMRWVTPDYFRVLGIPLRSGRFLTAADLNAPVSLINEALADKFFPRQDPTRKKLLLGVVDPQPQSIAIAGVVGNVREFGLDEEAPPVIYTITTSPNSFLLLKTAGNPLGLAAAIRETIRQAGPEIAVSAIRPVSAYVSDSLARRRFTLALLMAFAGLGALLTAAGIYGVLAYSVSRRIREFGIRSAIGATPEDLLRMIFREALTSIIPGLLAGFALSLALARLTAAMVYQISPQDPAALGACMAFLTAVCLLSAWLPARRAARADSGLALRQE